MTSRVEKEISVELKSGKIVTVEVTAIGSYDSNYGADADGNRGMGVWFLDDVEFKIPEVADDGSGLHNLEMKEAEDLLNIRLESEDFEFGSDCYDGYDDQDEFDFDRDCA